MRPIFAALLLWASPARGYFDAGASQTLGSDSYQATSVFFTLGQEKGFYFRPSFTHTLSSGTAASQAYSGRIGYDHTLFSLGMEGGATPRTGNYQAHNVAGDASLILGNRKKGRGLLRASLGVGGAWTWHAEHLPNRILKLTETDLYFPMDFKFFFFGLGAEYRRAFYDRELPAAIPRRLRRAVARGADPFVFGLLDWTANAQLSYYALPLVVPYAAYTYTDYKINQPVARAYKFGAKADLKLVELDGSYELLDAGPGTARKNYFSLGLNAFF